MHRPLLAMLSAGLLLVVVGCSSSPAATQPPGGVTPPPGGVATPTHAAGPLACTGMPTFSLQTPQPSFAQDADLNAHFPTQVDGQAVTEIHSYYWVQFLCYYQGEATLQRYAQALPGSSLATMSVGTAKVTVDGDDLTISAIRMPGQDPNQIIQHLTEFLVALGVDPADVAKYTVTQANIGGKTVSVVTDENGDVSYSVPSGDALFTIGNATDSEAAKVLAALP